MALQYESGTQAIAALTGAERVTVDNGGAVIATCTTQQIADLSAVEGDLVETPIATVGNGTLTAAGLVGGQIARNGPTGPFTDTTVTAALIVAALPSFVAGSTFVVRIKNGTQYLETLQGGIGVTMPSDVVVPPFSAWSAFGTVGGTAAVPTIVFTHISTSPIYGTLGSAPQVLAAAGQTQGTATAITTLVAIVTVIVTATHNGVKLPVGSTGVQVRVVSAVSGGGFKVYPATGCRISTNATNVADATNLAAFKSNVYVAVNATRWSVQRGA